MGNLDETREDDAIVVIVKQFTRELDEGNRPSIEQFVSQHPQLGDELRFALEGLMMVRQAEIPTPLPAASSESEFATKPIGDFQIIGELGRGGMGVVYEAIQLSLGRRVALKVLPFASGLDEVRLQRFRNEAHAAAALHHTNIVPVYAVGADRGVHYYAMQLIEGQTLSEVISELKRAGTVSTTGVTDQTKSPITTSTSSIARTGGNGNGGITFATGAQRNRHYRSVVTMIYDAAMAIHHAHTYGVIHRDIKPGNLIRDRTGKIWVTDFGLAQIESEASQLTRTGDPVGTLRYMSPEQASGNRLSIDHRADIYSLGATLYEMLVLRPAFEGDNYRQLLNDVVEKEPTPPRIVDVELPKELDTIVRKAMAKQPGDRYSSASTFANDLQAWLQDKPIQARPPTSIERLAKWRRRNSGIVAAIGIISLITSVAAASTMLLVLRQQSLTKQALDSEKRQRELAESNFNQARAAVDTFSELSERELAYRADLQGLRRQFLETSLAFYEDFVAQRAEDIELSQQVKETSDTVRKMVEELRVLDRIQPLMLIGDPRVQEELRLEEETAYEMTEALEKFRAERDALANQSVGGLIAENPELTRLIQQLDFEVAQRLTPSQFERLQQINRQSSLPFTFKSREIVEDLALTREQQLAINRIIEETRPSRRGRRGNRNTGPWDRRPIPNERLGGPQGPPPGDFGPQPPLFDPRGGFPQQGRTLWGPPPGTEITVREIREILTPTQLTRWESLIGTPFW